MGKQWDTTLARIDSVIPAAALDPFYCVDADGAVIAAAGVMPHGVVPWGLTASVPGSIVTCGTVPVILGGNVTRGHVGSVNASGKAVESTTPGHICCFRFLESGVTGNVVEAEFGFFGVVGEVTGAKQVMTIQLKDCVANATTRSAIMAVTQNIKILAARIGFYAKPASTLGTVLGNLKYWDASGDAELNMQAAADQDLEACVDKEPSAITLSATAANVQPDDGDFIYYEAVSNNGDMTGGTDGSITLEYEYRE